MIFLCEHETQGLAYQEALSSGVPVLAWDRGGDWRDPSYFPRVRFGPVSSVPYWDERCGERFESEVDFRDRLDLFFEKLRSSQYRPRDFILENLTLDLAARNYCRLVELA